MELAVAWNESAATPRVPVKKVNVIESGNSSDDAIKNHCDLVWAKH